MDWHTFKSRVKAQPWRKIGIAFAIGFVVGAQVAQL